ncbi:MAG: hypothetical protein II198_01515, partial [Bacteroidaceae bacterium]|nr:hypothetical protein [Bacteroidaceae bacterium]
MQSCHFFIEKPYIVTMFFHYRGKNSHKAMQNKWSIGCNRGKTFTPCGYRGHCPAYTRAPMRAPGPGAEATVNQPHSTCDTGQQVSRRGYNNRQQNRSRCDEVLKATIRKDTEKVAEIIELAHETYTSILKYNDENSLSCVIT